ncbi:MAG: tetratricopeptide repeat protein [Planctomycetota bacterium]
MQRPRTRVLDLAALRLVLPAIAGTLVVGACSSKPATVPPPAERLRMATDLAEQAEEARADEDNELAIELYQESVTTSGTVSAWNNLGVLLMEENEHAGAVSAFRRAAELEPTDPRPLTNIGIVYYETGWAEDAVRYFDLALDIDPNYLPALRGSAVATDLASRAEELDLERAHNALLFEYDPEWRRYFERRRSVVEARLREEERRRIPGE